MIYYLIHDLAWALLRRLPPSSDPEFDPRELGNALSEVEAEFVGELGATMKPAIGIDLRSVPLNDYVESQVELTRASPEFVLNLDGLLESSFSHSIRLTRRYEIRSNRPVVISHAAPLGDEDPMADLPSIVAQHGSISLVDDFAASGGTLMKVARWVRSLGGEIRKVYLFGIMGPARAALESEGITVEARHPDCYIEAVRDHILEGMYLGDRQDHPVFVPFLAYPSLPSATHAQRRRLWIKTLDELRGILADHGFSFDLPLVEQYDGFSSHRIAIGP